MTTRGIGSDDCVKIAELIDRAIQSAITLQEGLPKLIDFKNKVNAALLEDNSPLVQLNNEVLQFTERLRF